MGRLRDSQKKAGIDGDEARRKRGDTIVESRRKKKDEQVKKMRREMLGTEDAFDSTNSSIAVENMENKISEIPTYVQYAMSDDPALQLQATIAFRKLLSIERHPPIDEVVRQNMVPRFVQFLAFDQHPKLQFEAAWSLTNIASGTTQHTRIVIENGAIPVFTQLLHSTNDEIKEQAIWALGNIAGDTPVYRDQVLDCDALTPLLASLMSPNQKASMLRNATWTLSNFCRGKPQPDFEKVKASLPVLSQLIMCDDSEILTDSCWALSYLSDGSNEKIAEVIASGVIPNLVALLRHRKPSVLNPALRSIGNIVTGDDSQTQSVIASGGLQLLNNLLQGEFKKSIKKEACWTISNITAGSQNQIQMVLEANLIPILVHLLSEAEFEIQKEAAWAISNATSGGNHEQIKFLVQQGCILPLCKVITCQDNRIVTIALEGLQNILKVGEADKNLSGAGAINEFVPKIDEVGGLDAINALQEHHHDEIVFKAQQIIRSYFGEEGDDLDDSLIPMSNENQYNFGASNGMQSQPSGGFNF